MPVLKAKPRFAAGNGEPTVSVERLTISPPNIQTAVFEIIGTAPLVVHRFSKKVKDSIIEDMKQGSTAQNRKGKKREKLDPIAKYNEARYIAPEGWDGINASGLRCALIDVCRLVGYKMTLAKLSIFVIPDGWDKFEPEFPLIRIYGKPRMLESFGRLANGSICPIHRPCYDQWSAKVKVQYDADQFTSKDIAHLLMRVGTQNGIGEGRPNSKNSAGIGWGMFALKDNANEKRQNH